MAQPEAGDAAQQDAGRDFTVPEEVEQGVGEELVLGALTLTEVGRQLQAVFVHQCAPIV